MADIEGLACRFSGGVRKAVSRAIQFFVNGNASDIKPTFKNNRGKGDQPIPWRYNGYGYITDFHGGASGLGGSEQSVPVR